MVIDEQKTTKLLAGLTNIIPLYIPKPKWYNFKLKNDIRWFKKNNIKFIVEDTL